ncbi:sugar ABC transporter substrate-binding protein [Jeongeupia chitinilytica]|uniref:Probable sugar-binding periplasmic protein n=1 Tax=Jeongeupia chitinilytica TaxID=1041641 RepID=A0ABQ3H718_9NEIS|nr:sugar ABC transporter substrate-binding protein [Jeongeupia chitinilytica]
MLCVAAVARADDSFDVLHWWTSSSERRAVDELAERAADDGVAWRNAAIAGGAGIGAMKVLKARVLAGRAPDAAQLIGPAITEWADLGLLLELDDVAAAGNWNTRLFPTIWTLVRLRGHVVAAPLGIHRINVLFYNRKVFADAGLTPPKTWAEFDRVAAALAKRGVTPLAQSGQPWQVATLFETLALSEGGPGFYRSLYGRRNANLWFDARITRALERLRALRRYAPPGEPAWDAQVKTLARGDAAMFIMGDWAKGELQAMGRSAETDFGCIAVPGTENMHLYSVDSFVMFAGDYSAQPVQEKLARLMMSPAVQGAYNRIKGSVPVRRDADTAGMDACARASWRTFAHGAGVQAPSMVHRMATDETLKDAIIAQLHRYYTDEHMPVSEAQRRIAGLVRTLAVQGGDDK